MLTTLRGVPRITAPLVLAGAGLSLLTLAMVQAYLRDAYFPPMAVPLQIITLFGFAAALWTMAFRRFTRGLRHVGRPSQAAMPLVQGTALNAAALYTTGFAFILTRLLVFGYFPFDEVNVAEILGLILLGTGLLTWSAYRIREYVPFRS